MDKLQELQHLYERLFIPNTVLIITDENTGAGYIEDSYERVIVRWGSYQEAIRILNILIQAG